MTVHIQVNERYAIGADSRNWIIRIRRRKLDEKRQPIPGEYSDNWDDIGFYPNLNLLIKELKLRMVRESDIGSANQLYKAAEEIDALFSKIHFKVVGDIRVTPPGG